VKVGNRQAPHASQHAKPQLLQLGLFAFGPSLDPSSMTEYNRIVLSTAR
jgi:hypothetical protein